VDDPEDAVAQSQTLVAEVMHERGYPTEHRDQVAADLSVEHAKTIGNFRAAEEISQKATAGTASTEDLRQAMIHYRALFRDLLGDATERGEDPALPPEDADGEFASSQNRSGEVPPPAADYEDYEPAAGRHAAASAPVNGETARDAMTRDEAAADGAATDEPAPGRTGRRS
jgi:hypothetical protein